MLPVPHASVLSGWLSVLFSSADRLLWCFFSPVDSGAITPCWERCWSGAHHSWESPGRGKAEHLALLRGTLAFILPVL